MNIIEAAQSSKAVFVHDSKSKEIIDEIIDTFGEENVAIIGPFVEEYFIY
jgi:hypothetical protein